MLVAPKEKLTKEENRWSVYHISFPNTYIGETGRALKWRILEHKWDSSPVADLMKSSGHHVDLNNVDGIQILDQHPSVGWERSADTDWNIPGEYLILLSV